MKEIYKALSEFQAKCPLIKKDASNPFYKSKYAPLDSILPIVLPLLKEVGLVITQIPEGNSLKTIVAHLESGETLEGTADLILDKQNPQGQGSAITYMRRYALVAMLGLNTDEDDDGNKASVSPKTPSKTSQTDKFDQSLDEDLKAQIEAEIKRLEPTMDRMTYGTIIEQKTGMKPNTKNLGEILNKLKAL